MTVFDTIRDAVDIVEVARLYGIGVDRHNKACCPYHNEKTPSFVLYPNTNTFYCFGCGAHGDALDIVMNAGGARTPLEAAGELNQAFRLGLDLKQQIDPAEARRAQAERERVKAFEEWKHRAANTYAGYFRLLREWRREHTPTEQGEPLHPLFIESLHKLDYIGYICESINEHYRDFDKMAQFYKTHEKEVRRIEQRINESGHTGQCGLSPDAGGTAAS